MRPTPLALVCSLASLSLPAVAQPEPGPESTLLLTWFDDPSTSMVVQWLTEGDTPPRAEGSAAVSAFEVPRLKGELEVDGNPADWADAGLRTDFIPLPDGGWPDPETTLAGVRTAWTTEGLAVLVEVEDDDPSLFPPLETDWGTRLIGDRVHLTLTGKDPEGPKLRVQAGRPEEGGEPGPVNVTESPRGEDAPEVAAAVVLTEEGYRVEAVLPWSAMPKLRGEAGQHLGLQVEVFDTADAWWAPVSLSWAGSAYPSQDGRRVAPLVLVPAGQVDPVRARIAGRRPVTADGGAGPRVLAIGGEPRLIGERVVVKSGDLVLGEVTLENVSGWAAAELPLGGDFGSANPAARLDAVSVELDGATIARELLEASFWASAPEAATVSAVDGEQAPEAMPAVEVLPFAGSGWFLQRAEFTGLEAGTDYAVAVPGRLKPVRFRTAPATHEEPVVFAEGGDVGTSHHVGMLHEEAAAWDPLFGLVGGDCAYGNGLDPEAWYDYLELWNDHMTPAGGRSVPMVCAVGNHETVGNGNGGRPQDSPFFRALFGPLFSARGAYATLDFGTGETPWASIYLLDSGHTSDHDGHQTDWLDAALGERAGVEHQLVAYHVPAYPSVRGPGGGLSTEAREHWVPRFERQPVDLVFEHHDHAYKRTHPLVGGEADPAGVTYLGDGCWGRSPRKVSPERDYLAVAKSERNVMRVTLHPDGSREVLAVNEHGEVLDTLEHAARGSAADLIEAGVSSAR